MCSKCILSQNYHWELNHKILRRSKASQDPDVDLLYGYLTVLAEEKSLLRQLITI